MSTQHNRIVFGTGGGNAKGIYIAEWHPAAGEIGEIRLAAEIAFPTFLAIHPQGEHHLVYAVSETGETDSRVTAFRIDADKKELRRLNDVASRGGGPTHIAVSPNGSTVVCANYGTGSSSSFRVLEDGSLTDCVSHFQYAGAGPYVGRQEAPHTHSVNPSPDGRWVLVSDLGIDRIFVYALDEGTAQLTPNDPLYWAPRPGSGPRHLAFHPTGEWVYSINELTSTVDTLKWNSRRGVLTTLGAASTLPQGFPPNTAFAGEILCSQDGRHVYVGNRVADDTIAVFEVDRGSGLLELMQFAGNPGKNPRHIALDPSGRWLVISNVESGTVAVLARDSQTGRLSQTGRSYELEAVQFAGFL